MTVYPANETDLTFLDNAENVRVQDGKLQTRSPDDSKFYDLTTRLLDGLPVVTAEGNGED